MQTARASLEMSHISGSEGINQSKKRKDKDKLGPRNQNSLGKTDVNLIPMDR